MKTEKTAVIFRTFKENGEVIALFPFEPATNAGWTMESYMHVGQHGSASPELTQGGRNCPTRPSEPKEICGLACELRGIGYKLHGMSRIPRNAYEIRKSKLNK